MLRLSAGDVAVGKFPCIVCSLETDSIEELHDHQKYRHTTTELSWSVICLVHYMGLRNGAGAGRDFASKYSASVSQSHPTNWRFYQSHNAKENNEALYHSNISTGDFKKSYNQLVFNTRATGVNLKAPFLSSLEIELGRIPDISDETFLNCVYGICEDLEVIGKTVNKRRKGLLKSACTRTNQLACTEKICKRLTRSQKKRLILQASRNNDTKDSLYSNFFDEKSRETANGNLDSKDFDQTLPNKEIPMKVSKDSNYEQEFREMPVLEPQIVQNDVSR